MFPFFVLFFFSPPPCLCILLGCLRLRLRLLRRHQQVNKLFFALTVIDLALHTNDKILWAAPMVRLFSCQTPLCFPWQSYLIFATECLRQEGSPAISTPSFSTSCLCSGFFFFFFERCSGEKRAREQHSGETIAPQGMPGPGSCEEDVNMNPLVLLFLTLLNENTSPPHGRCWPPVYPDPVGWLWLVDVITQSGLLRLGPLEVCFCVCVCMCVWNLV